MATRHQTIECAPGAAVLLTNGTVTAARVHNLGGESVDLQATLTATPPTSRQGALALGPSQTLATDLTLEQLFPGVGTGPYYLWAFVTVQTRLSVSHA